jgi:hypothetical protein
MNGGVVLHIGAMKTGTSFVQSVLQEHPEQLAAAGAVFVRSFGEQMRAVQEGLRVDGDFTMWRKLVAKPRRHRTSIISMEFLSYAHQEHIEAFLEPLQGREVRVVLTVRDQLRTLPAQWQTHTRNFGTASWEAYLREVCRAKAPRHPTNAYRTYHRAQDYVEILERWSRHPGVSSVAVVTVPPTGAPHEELWHRFCRAAGIDVPGVCLDAVKDNPSIGYASCDALRRLNEDIFGTTDAEPSPTLLRLLRLRSGPSRDDAERMPGYRRQVRAVVRESLAPLRQHETRPVVDNAAAQWAVRRNREVGELVARSRVTLVGSLDDLPTTASEADFPIQAAPPPADQLLRAARAMWNHLADASGRRGDPPDDLERLTSESAALLRVLCAPRA